MELWVRGAWICLILVHLAPAAVVVSPRLVETLYQVSPEGDLGVLLIHRGALFLAVVAVAALALVDPAARRAAVLVVAISVVSFLIVYARAGMPEGALRTIALVDAAALAPLALAGWAAWRDCWRG